MLNAAVLIEHGARDHPERRALVFEGQVRLFDWGAVSGTESEAPVVVDLSGGAELVDTSPADDLPAAVDPQTGAPPAFASLFLSSIPLTSPVFVPQTGVTPGSTSASSASPLSQFLRV